MSTFFCHGAAGEWSAYDENDKKITDSAQINDLLEISTQDALLEATKLLLLVLGYTENEHGIEIVDDHIEMTVDGTVVKIYPKFDLRDEFHYEGHTYLMEDKGEIWIKVEIFVGKNIPCNGLIQLLGHEMTHVHQFTSGDYQKWESKYGKEVAEALAEIETVTWNFDHMALFPYGMGFWKSYFDKYVHQLIENWPG